MAQAGVLDEKRYGRLPGKYRPRMIHSEEELDRLSVELESLDAIEEDRELDAEERELQALLAHLRTEYEDLPEAVHLLLSWPFVGHCLHLLSNPAPEACGSFREARSVPHPLGMELLF